MNKIARWLKITCKDTSPLLSERMDHSLALGKRLRLWAHLAICGMCRGCQNQLTTLRSLARSMGDEDSDLNSSAELSKEAKERIKQSIKSSNL